MKNKPVSERLSGKQKVYLLIVFLIPIVVLEIFEYFSKPPTELSSITTEIEIPKGATLSQIADSLFTKNIIKDKDFFIFWAKSFGYEKKMRAGYFSIPFGMNDYQVVYYLTKAKENTISITLVEGWDISQIADEIEKRLGIPAHVILNICNDANFISDFDIDSKDLEGYLLPDTYSFNKGESPTDIVRYLVEKTLNLFESDSVKDAMDKLKMTQREILTLASIVEGEALLDDERPVIASLYYNRLKINMRLQADPTIQYIVEGPPRRLLTKDLEIDSPYNTYLYKGLPPGPINNPGKASILAALFPDSTGFLYMVATGDGGHNFSKNLKDHLEAKTQFDNIRRKVARERQRKGI